MSDFDKIAIVGEADLVFAFRALGVHTFSPRDVEDVQKIMAKIEKENFALCFVHQRWLEAFKKERKESEKKFFPAAIGFSDHRSSTDDLEKMVREMAVKATGCDSLVKKKGKDGAT